MNLFGKCRVYPCLVVGATRIERLKMGLFVRSVQDGDPEAARQAAASSEEHIARTQFLIEANRFVALWGDFASHLNDQQTFDARLAKKLSKAFRELERSDGWPAREQGK